MIRLRQRLADKLAETCRNNESHVNSMRIGCLVERSKGELCRCLCGCQSEFDVPIEAARV